MNVAFVVDCLAIEERATRDELSALRAPLGAGFAATSVEAEDGVELIEVALAGDAPVDLSSLPGGKVTRLRVLARPHATEVSLSNLGPDAVVELQMPEIPANEEIRTLRLLDCRGQVRVSSTIEGIRLRSSGPGGIGDLDGVPDSQAPSVVVEAGTQLTVDDRLGRIVLVLRGGHVFTGSRIAHVVLAGSGSLEGVGGSVELLTVVENSMLTLDSEMPTIVDVVGERAADGLGPALVGLELQALSDRGVPSKAVHLNHVRDLGLSAGGLPLDLDRVMTLTDVEIHAGLTVHLCERATVVRTEFVAIPSHDGGEIRPVVTAEPGTYLLDVTGSVELGSAPGVHIAAGSGGLGVYLHRSVEHEEKPWEGAMMTGIALPPGLVGRRVLDKLDSAYQFTPAVSGLPGRDQTVVSRVLRRRATDYGEGGAGLRRLFEDAEFMRQLAVLCRQKGTPGSVATSVAWCAYRLRSLKSRGVERVALGAYRWLGYGERPLPAFLSWAVLSIGLAGPVLAAGGAHPDPAGVETFFVEAGRLALGPLAGLLRGGTLSGGDFAEIAARALASVPLVTGSLALRNYVKS